MGILHRDVKPGNVLIDEKGWTYLSDFGLAKMVEGSVQLTGSGVGVGTPAYMSPEQGQGLPVDGRTDVYSLGIILYEMLTGACPTRRRRRWRWCQAHHSPLPPPRSLNPAIPRRGAGGSESAGQRPQRPFPRAGALAAALEAALSQVQGEPAVVPPPAPRPAANAGGADLLRSTPSRRRSGRPPNRVIL